MSTEDQPVRAMALTQQHGPRLLRYAAAGAAGTGMHYAVMFLLLGVLTPVLASTVGAALGAVVNFVLARRWVFADRRNLRFALPKFGFVALAVLGVNAAILSVMLLSLPVLPAQLIATGCAFLAGYVLNDAWSFHDRIH